MASELVSTGVCPHKGCLVETWMTRAQYDHLYKTGDSFFCLKGHSQSYPGQAKIDEERRRIKAAERQQQLAEEAAAEARRAQEAALKAKRKAERTCPWPTCEGKVLRSVRALRQHMVDDHGAPWASPELSADEVAQVLNGRDQTEVVR